MSLFIQFLKRPDHAEFAVLIGQSALEINIVWRPYGRIGAQFDGRALYEGACRHDYLILVSWHIPRQRNHMGVDGCRSLNPFAKCDDSVRCAKLDSLNDVASFRIRGRTDRITQVGKDLAAEHGSFHSAVYCLWRQEEVPQA